MKSYENSFNKRNGIENKLNQIRRQVDVMVDKVGMPVDEGIKETVVVLMALDFKTSSSCAGHTYEKEGYGPPYVEFYTNGPEGWKDNAQKQEEWRIENTKQREKLLPLLNKFYQARNTLLDAKLHFRKIGIYGGFRLESEGASKSKEELGVKTKDDVVDKIKLYQKEMKDFTDFLMNEYLSREG